MSRKTSTPARSREATEQVPDRLELRCLPGRITLEALAVEGEVESIPRFTMVAYTGEPLRVEGWRFPVVVDLEGLSIPSQRRPVRFGHSMYAGVGHTERIAVEAGRLIAEGIVSRDTIAAREVVASGKRGFPWQASIGAQVAQAEFVRAGKNVTVNGRTFDGPLYVARRTTLGEISFVDLGADGNTTATIAAQQQENELMDETKDTEVLETEAQDVPQDDAARDDQAEGAGTEASPAATPGVARGTQAANPVADIRAQAVAETKRIAAIRSVCANKHPAIEAQAIAEGWTRDRTELAVLRENRPKAPAVHVTENAMGGALLEAACLLTAKLSKVEEHVDEPTLEAASRRFRGGITLQELLLEAAWANGYTGRNFRDSREVLRFAFAQNLAAGFSTIDIGGILSNVANKFLLEGFFSVERTWRNLCAVRNVSDFKTVTSYRLIGKDQYEQVAPGGELKHGTLGEQAYTNKADTYGLLLSIDRRDIINDDLGAITTVPRKLGRGSGLKINDIFWLTFLANSDFFKAANNNYLTGADTALSIEGLSKAEVAFLNQTDPDGKPLGAMPAVVLVPTALSAMATVLYKSLEIRDTTASTRYPWQRPRKRCGETCDPWDPDDCLHSYMHQWDASGDLDWLCDFRKMGGFPITLAFLADSSRNKLVAAAGFRAPVLLRPGTSLHVRYQARIFGRVTADFALRFAKYAFQKTGSRYATIYCRPLLATAPAFHRRLTYADVQPFFDAHFTGVALSSWTFVAGPPARVDSATAPQWTNSSGTALGPFAGLAVYGLVGGSNELMWITPIDPPVSVPAGDVLRVPNKVRLVLGSL